MIIRNQPTDVASAMSSESAFSTNAISASAPKRRTSISGSTIASYFGVFLLVVTLVTVAYRPPVHSDASLASVSTSTPVKQVSNYEATSASSVDQVMATSLASSLAESIDMPISNNVANLSQSLGVESALAQTDANVISKPQVVSMTANARTPQKYQSVAGDTTTSIGEKYGVSAQTIRWANNMSSDAVEPGRSLTVLPFDGVLYTVKAGDTVDTIASKYGGDKPGIVADNDLELTGAPAVGSQVLIRGGTLPENERPGYVAPRQVTASTNRSSYNGIGGNYSGGHGNAYSGNISAGNKYAWGNCTWYAYERRMQLGRPIGSFWGNASTWAYNGRAAGFAVDGNPSAGAIMANGGGYGHVAIVESVNPGVSVTISEMNGYRFGGGFARVGHGDIPWGEATSGMYQYIH